MKTSLIFSFIIATFFTIFSSSLFPYFKPVFYAPFLVLLFFNLRISSTLWLSCLSGLIVDLFSSTHLGLHALISILCASFFYRQKRFFKETPINIAIFSSLISFVYVLLNAILLFVFEKGIKITPSWVMTDLIAMSFFDGLYALICFALPIKAFELIKKRKLVEDDDE